MKITTTFLLLFLSTIAIAQTPTPTIQWQKGFGGSLFETGGPVLTTPDGGFIVTGSTRSNNGTIPNNHGVSTSDILVMKTDASGNIIWQKCYGSTGGENITDLKRTMDGGYIVLGYTDGNDGDVNGFHGGSDIWLFKINATGNLLWQKCYGGSNFDYGGSLQLTTDSGFIIVGTVASTNGDIAGNHGGNDAYVFKIAANGTVQWQKCYGGTGLDGGLSIINTADSGYVFAGSSSSNNGDVSGVHGSNTDIWVVKINNTGVLQWQKCYGGIAADRANSIITTSDGGYMIGGVSGDTTNTGDFLTHYDSEDAQLVKINNIGTIEWTKNYGGNDQDAILKTVLTSDGGCLMYGGTYSNTNDVVGYHGGGDAWLAKVSPNGMLQWQSCIGNYGPETVSGVVETSDNGYIILLKYDMAGGIITEATHGYSDILMIKLSPDSTLRFGQICPYGSTSLRADVAGTPYQWQISTDSVQFYNITDSAVYTGTNTALIHLTAVPPSWYGYRFRCIAGSRTSAIYTIRFVNRWIGTTAATNWEASTNWSCGSLPDASTDAVILSGNIFINSNVTVRSLKIYSGAMLTVTPGYQLTIIH